MTLRNLILLCLTVASVSTAIAQPILGIHLSTNKPTLRLVGTPGTIYVIQNTTGLSPTSVWLDCTLLQGQTTNVTWTDPRELTAQRFYRALSLTPPADTNLIFIKPGTFTMGSPANETDRDADEGPQTTVTLSRGFWISRYEVTQGQFQKLMVSNPSTSPADTNRPVDSVTWTEANSYCALLTQDDHSAGSIPTNCAYRLPTEAEWEYICRAGTTTRFSHGNDPSYTQVDTYAWNVDNSGLVTHPIGQKSPNPWGLHDIHGNVWEWCQDWYAAFPGGSVVDHSGPLTGSNRVLRGAGWQSTDAGCRTANRGNRTPATRQGDFGFRVVLALNP
jgi:formylglycine-generating enzyme required for sulfatase activity